MNVNPFSYLIEKLKSKADTAGTGLAKSGTTISTYVPRVNQDANTKPGQFSFNILEYDNQSTNLPTNDFYHILTTEGQDARYVVQLALGMTADKAFVRKCYNDTWGLWNELAFKSDIPNITVLEIDTTGKSLNTAYSESLPTGYTRDNCIMSTACFIKYDTQYSLFSLIDDPDLAISIGITSSSQLGYTLIGSQTLNGILKVALIKYS